MDVTEFDAANHTYIQRALTDRGPDPHSELLLDEILDDVEKGRMTGPFQAPPHWVRPTVAPAAAIARGMILAPPPSGPVGAALAFAIHQTNQDGTPKVRRGEDWRRSFHNAATSATDAPMHHDMDAFIATALSCVARAGGLVFACRGLGALAPCRFCTCIPG